MVNSISLIDGFTFTVLFCSVWIFIFREFKSFHREKMIILLLLLFQAAYSGTMAAKWAGITHRLEFIENIVGAIIPVLWLFLFYSLIENKSREKLKKNETHLKITLDSLSDAIITTNRKGEILQMNLRAEKMLGTTLDEVRLKPLTDFFQMLDSKTRVAIENPVLRVLQGKEKLNFQHVIYQSKPGLEYVIDASLTPFLNEQSLLSGAVLNFRDVTDELKIQEQLLHSRKMDAVGKLAGGIAHDFNNMLTGILGSAELLKDVVKSEEAKEYVKIILEAAERSTSLTRKILDFSRNEGPRQFEDVDIHDVIDQSLSILEKSIDKKISIQRTFLSSRSHIIGDRTELQNMFINLGINGADSMPAGGKLEFRTNEIILDEGSLPQFPFIQDPGLYIKIEVVDEGSGIPKEILPRIFEPFFSTKAVGKGTGLGLAAVYGGVKKHRGTISVYSEIGLGTSFKILLPLSDHDCGEFHPEDNEPARGAAEILIIDNEVTLLKTIKEFLNHLGYRTHCFSDSHLGLQYFEKHYSQIDLVIVDYIMPSLNGEDIFYQLRKIRPDISVIMVSGFTNNETIQKLKAKGLKGFLSKPFSQMELSKALKEALMKEI